MLFPLVFVFPLLLSESYPVLAKSSLGLQTLQRLLETEDFQPGGFYGGVG
jgi:hypothetical protein